MSWSDMRAPPLPLASVARSWGCSERGPFCWNNSLHVVVALSSIALAWAGKPEGFVRPSAGLAYGTALAGLSGSLEGAR